MKKALFIAVFALLAAIPARAQFSRINSVTLVNGDNSQAAFYASPFTIKVGAACTWSITGTIATINCGGAPVTPGAPVNSIQFNNAGAFGGVSDLLAGQTNCDGFGSPCILFAQSSGTFKYILSGNNSAAPMGNYYDFYQFTDGGIYADSYNGTIGASLGFAPHAAFLTAQGTGKTQGIQAEPDDSVIEIGRLSFSPNFTTASDPGAFAPSGGWGNTATVSSTGGADNNFRVEITAGGAGIAANPTIVYTYKDGDFNSGSSSSPIFICTQTGGDDVLADVTVARGQTAVTLTWHGTATGGKKYEISCIGMQRN